MGLGLDLEEALELGVKSDSSEVSSITSGSGMDFFGALAFVFFFSELLEDLELLLPASFFPDPGGVGVDLALPLAVEVRERILVRSAKERPSRLVAETSLIEDGPAIARAGSGKLEDAFVMLLLAVGSVYPGTPLCAGRGLGRGLFALLDDSGEKADMLECVSGAWWDFDKGFNVKADTVDVSPIIV